LQKKKIRDCIEFGTPAFAVAGDQGVENYYADLIEWFSDEKIEGRLEKLRQDSYALQAVLNELTTD
jgi:hypothetical protein